MDRDVLWRGLRRLAAALIGYLSFRFRVRGVYFSLITMASAEIVRLLFEHTDFFGSTVGIFIKAVKGPAGAAYFQFGSKWPFLSHHSGDERGYPGGLLISSNIRSWATILKAIKENEDSARSLGVSAIRYQISPWPSRASSSPLAAHFTPSTVSISGRTS